MHRIGVRRTFCSSHTSELPAFGVAYVRFAHGQMIRCVHANAMPNSHNDDVDQQSALIQLIFPVDLLFNQSATANSMQFHFTNRNPIPPQFPVKSKKKKRSRCILVRLPKQLFMARQMRSGRIAYSYMHTYVVRLRSS